MIMAGGAKANLSCIPTLKSVEADMFFVEREFGMFMVKNSVDFQKVSREITL